MTKLVTVLAAMMVFVAVAPAHAQTPKRGGVFHVPAPEAPTIDPHLNAGFVTQVYASLIYSCLVRLPAGPELRGPGGHRILPDVAEQWERRSPATLGFTLSRGGRLH